VQELPDGSLLVQGSVPITDLNERYGIPFEEAADYRTIAGFILVPTLWAEEGLTAAIVMLVVILVYQQVENNILTPKIQGKAVQLSAFFIIVAVTLFGALLGVLGAITAVPIAATLQIFVQELTKARRADVAAAKAGLVAPADAT